MVMDQWEGLDGFIVFVNNNIMYICYGDIHSLPFSFHSTTTDVVLFDFAFPFRLLQTLFNSRRTPGSASPSSS